jgi:hypothetical protein
VLTLLTPPTVLPVSVAEAQINSRVTESFEDGLFTDLIHGATEDAEHAMGRAILPQQWKLTLDGFATDTRESALVYLSAQQWRPALDSVNGLIYLRRPIVTAVNSVKYLDAITGAQVTLAGTEYITDLGGELLSRIGPAYNKTWPATLPVMNAVEIVFTCGWADASAVPGNIKNWIKQRVSALYENREAWTLGKRIEANPEADRLLDRWRVRSF